jgi:hypothetical protein
MTDKDINELKIKYANELKQCLNKIKSALDDGRLFAQHWQLRINYNITTSIFWNTKDLFSTLLGAGMEF